MRRQVSYPKKPGSEIIKARSENPRASGSLCLTCKGGRSLCGTSPCPLLQKLSAYSSTENKLKEDFFGPAPSIFVGHSGYPDVFVGPMTSLDPEKAALLDNPADWYGSSLDDIIHMRSLLVRSKRRQGIKEKSRYIEQSKEIALSVKPTDIEVLFKTKPTYRMNFSPISQPTGPSGVVEKFTLTENPKIPRRVDAVVSDELRSADAALALYKNQFDVYYLTTVLSSGALGAADNKKLVPTRWSITAVDDIIAKALMKDIREFPQLNEFLVYENTYLDNHFEVLMMPGAWEFEQFEAWSPNTLWTPGAERPVIQAEYEGFLGRTKYAEKEGGGYYAARLGVVEKLHEMRRQARAIVFREIYEGYSVPVGVWEVRENVRHALGKKPEKFTNLSEALAAVQARLRISVSEYARISEILKQRKIVDYF